MRRHEHSQHFLRNPYFVARLIDKVGIDSSDTVYDIGAGSGVITTALARKAKQVVAIELEPLALRKLRENTQSCANVSIVEGDILAMPLPSGRYKVFANIPFHISSQIVRRLTENAQPPIECFLIVQKQFAQKLVLDNSHFTGALAMMIAPWFTVSVVRPLRRSDFSPPPNVDTVLMKITRRRTALLPVVYAANYRQFVADCYHDPKLFAKTPRVQQAIATDRNPSQLSIEEWVRLYMGTRHSN
ncbi:methyltransferase domain-containing protein [Candidatus Saccharibacteria bacterium]|nr:MAG: methyltransferase domain-containing protein [Candidatus Saccharibacteria bacterium]